MGAPAKNDALVIALKKVIGGRLSDAFHIRDKLQRRDAIAAVKDDVIQQLAGRLEVEGWNLAELLKEFGELEYRTMRDALLDTKVRIDGRSLEAVRPITVKVGVLPRVHGSGLFTRGETQAIVVTTLGTARDGQVIDAVTGEYKENFYSITTSRHIQWANVAVLEYRSAVRSVTAVLLGAGCWL